MTKVAHASAQINNVYALLHYFFLLHNFYACVYAPNLCLFAWLQEHDSFQSHRGHISAGE